MVDHTTPQALTQSPDAVISEPEALEISREIQALVEQKIPNALDAVKQQTMRLIMAARQRLHLQNTVIPSSGATEPLHF